MDLNKESIKWIKNINFKSEDGEIKFSFDNILVGQEFDLNISSARPSSIERPEVGDIILLIQNYDKEIQLTQIVTPVDEKGFLKNTNDHFGYVRKCIMLWRSQKGITNPLKAYIPAGSKILITNGHVNDLQNLSGLHDLDTFRENILALLLKENKNPNSTNESFPQIITRIVLEH